MLHKICTIQANCRAAAAEKEAATAAAASKVDLLIFPSRELVTFTEVGQHTELFALWLLECHIQLQVCVFVSVVCAARANIEWYIEILWKSENTFVNSYFITREGNTSYSLDSY